MSEAKKTASGSLKSPSQNSEGSAKEDPSAVKEVFKAPNMPDTLMKYEHGTKEDLLFKNREEVFKDLDSILIKIKPDAPSLAPIQQTTEA